MPCVICVHYVKSVQYVKCVQRMEFVQCIIPVYFKLCTNPYIASPYFKGKAPQRTEDEDPSSYASSTEEGKTFPLRNGQGK